MDFSKDLFLKNLLDTITNLFICFYKFNFQLKEYYNSFINFILDVMNLIFRRRVKVIPKDEMFLVFNGDTKLLDYVPTVKKSSGNKSSISTSCSNSFCNSSDTIKCWDYKKDIVFNTKLNMNDLLTHYFRFYKVYEKTKRDFLLKIDSVFVVLTDIAKSTELWNKDRFKMARSIIEHDNIFYELIDFYCGIELRNEGDSFLAAFLEKDQCLNFAKEFYERVSNISFDKKLKIKVKVVVNYEKIIDKKSVDLISKNIKDTYQMISHSSPSKICISEKISENVNDSMFCYHSCK